MAFPGIPAVPPCPQQMNSFLQMVKLSLELLTGARGATPYQLTAYSVANLPPNAPGLVAYAYDGCKAGEASGAGSGVMIYSDKTRWNACDTSLAVTK